VGLAGELLKQFEHLIANISLVPSDGGRFEVTVNNRLVYSKLKTGRHVQPGEVVGLINKMVEG
jgi:selenoprotein W-related protein